MSNLAYGTFTITNLSVVTSVDIYYYNSTSSTSLSGGSWSTNTPTWTNGKYIWSKTVTTWEQGVTTQSEPVCITGQKGSTGSTGQSVTSIVEQYALSTSNTTAPTTGWSNTMPAFEANKYYWTRSKITWANPTNTTYTDAVLANGITSANTTANAANTTATQANQTANTANQTANAASQTAADAASAAAAAQSTANNATSIANGKNTIYYGANFPAGGTYKAGDTFFKQSAEGYIIYKYDTTDKQWVKESLDEQGITQITNAKIANLDGGKINAGTITSLKLSTDAIKSRNYQAGTAPYSATGTFLDLTQGNIYTPNFGVNNDSLDSIDDGAYIRGSIYAHKGTIGQSSTNYWYIGNYKDYNQVNSAMIKGYGTATIQLGESNTWRLNTNRIHTAWNDDSSANEAYRLHYLIRDSKYWDMGLHVPTSGIDKFIYIRSSKSDTSTANILENLQNSLEDNLDGTNNYWTYKFFISADGGIYARNIYAIDENGNYTLISGANGAYLLKSGGTIQNNLVINGTLQVKGNYLNKNGNALTLQTNLGSTTAGTLTGNTTSAISVGVTGTLPSSNGGTGNTNWNQGGVVYIDGSSPKKLLSTAAGTSGYLLKANGTGAPTWINPATLTVAAATKATQDGDGNVIKTTYLKLSGGNVTGPVSFGDSVSVDDLNAGTLVVTGNASFTNNIQANTINGVAVGSSPKFTDTITTVSTTGSGNAVTAITASNGAITVTKGTTFLTGITSSQVTTALGYTPYNSTNPNGYTSNTGTVTQVTAGTGLKIGTASSGGNITTTGTINHINSVTAQTTQALYPIKIDAQGHISAYGSAVTSWALSAITGADDLKAIEALTGTSGFLKKTAANIWELDTNIYLTGITSSQVTTALGYTPYNSTNPDGYTTNTGTVTSVAASGSGGITISGSPITTSGTLAIGLNLSTAINGLGEGTSPANRNDYAVVQYAGGGTTTTSYHRRKLSNVFAALIADDIPNLDWSKITSGNDDLKAIEALSGTSGFLKKTAANTWSLDTNTYLTTHQTVTDKNPTLAWGTKSAVATIGSTTINVTMPANPNYIANLITGASNSAKTTAAASNGSVFLNLVENNTVRNYHNLKGGNGLTVTSDANGVVTFTSPAAFTGVSFNDGKLTFTKSDGNSAELTTSSFVITQAAGATGLVNSSGTGLNVGGATTKPIYFSNGVPVEVTSIPYTLLSGAPSTMTPASHTHGNIQNGGTLQTTDITIANGDKLIVTDASDSNKIARTSVSFDGSTATKALTQKGTWETFNNYSLPLAANGTRGGVQIGYTTSGKNYAVQLSGQKMYVNVPWTDTNTQVTNTLGTTTKFYVTGTSSASTNTGTQYFDTGVYVTTVAGELSALKYSVHDTSSTPVEKVRMEWNSTDLSLDFIFI